MLKGSNELTLVPVGPVVPAETGSTVTVELGLVVDEPLEELAGGEVKV